MAFFGLFGKKKKEEEIPEMPPMGEDELGLGLGERPAGEYPSPEEQPPLGAPPGFGMPGFKGGAQPQTAVQPLEREYEVLSAKLDALKAILDSINQRLENLERIARGDHEHYY